MELKFGIYANCSEWNSEIGGFFASDDDEDYWIELEETVKTIVAEKEWD